MKKKIGGTIFFGVALLIGSLWVIEYQDAQALENAKEEFRAAGRAYEEAKATVELMKNTKGKESPKVVSSLADQALHRSTRMYIYRTLHFEDSQTMQTMDLRRHMYHIQEIIGKEKLTDEDFKKMNEEIKEINEIVLNLRSNLKQIENKINHYWWTPEQQ